MLLLLLLLSILLLLLVLVHNEPRTHLSKSGPVRAAHSAEESLSGVKGLGLLLGGLYIIGDYIGVI